MRPSQKTTEERKWVLDTINKYFDVIVEEENEEDEEGYEKVSSFSFSNFFLHICTRVLLYSLLSLSVYLFQGVSNLLSPWHCTFSLGSFQRLFSFCICPFSIETYINLHNTTFAWSLNHFLFNKSTQRLDL